MHLLLVSLCISSFLFCRSAEKDYRGWVKTSSKYFTFIYEPVDKGSAAHLLTFADEYFEKITSFLKNTPPNIQVILFSRSEDYNGYFMPYPPRIVLYTARPVSNYGPSTMDDWIKTLFVHELTHYIEIFNTSGFFYKFGRIFSGDAPFFIDVFRPNYLTEGIAIYTESKFSNGGRGGTTFFEMEYKGLVYDELLCNVYRFKKLPPYTPLQSYWLNGYFFVDFYIKTYGENAYIDFHNRFMRFPFFGPWMSLKKSSKKRYRELLGEMEEYYKKKYKAEFDISDGKMLGRKGIAHYFHPHADKKKKSIILYCLYDRKFLFSFISIDLKTGKSKYIARIPLTDYYSFSVSGTYIYFSSYTRSSFPTPKRDTAVSQLYRLNRNTGKVNMIPGTAHHFHPAVSEDDIDIFAVKRLHDSAALVRIDLHTGKSTELVNEKGVYIYYPSLSPDRTKIAYVQRESTSQDIYVYDIKKNRSFPLYGKTQYGEYFPRWRNNEKLIYTSDRHGSIKIYEHDLETGTSVIIAEDPVGAYNGIVISDTEILYSSYRGKSGYRFFKKEIKDIAVSVLDADEKTISGNSVERIEEFPQERYYDIPKLIYWSPVPDIIFTDSELYIKPKITTLFLSPLHDTRIHSSIGYAPDVMQPFFDLSLSFYLYPMKAVYNAGYDFYRIPGITYLSHSIACYPLLFSSSFPGRGLSAAVGIIYGGRLYQYHGDGLIPFPDSVKVSSYTESYIGLYSFIRNSKMTGRSSLYNPFFLRISSSLYKIFHGGINYNGEIQIGLPLILRKEALYLNTQYSFLDLRRIPVLPAANPRGFTESVSYNNRIVSGISLKHSFVPIHWSVYYDILHLRGIGLDVHVDLLYFPTRSGLVLYDYIYPGLEIDLSFSYDIHIKIGAALKYNRDELSFDTIKQYTTFYFTLQYNGGALYGAGNNRIHR
ncbi:TolB family protein [Spirochaetota bacterium]